MEDSSSNLRALLDSDPRAVVLLMELIGPPIGLRPSDKKD